MHCHSPLLHGGNKIMEKQERKSIMFDTSKEAWEKIGIYVTDEQYEELRDINLFMPTQDSPIPVHYIMLVLKALGLLPKSPINDNSQCDKETHSPEYYAGLIKCKYGEVKQQ